MKHTSYRKAWPGEARQRQVTLIPAKRQALPRPLAGRRGFGLNEVIGIAAGIIIAAVIVIPGLQTFASSLIANLQTWWTSMSSSIFSTGG